MSTSPRGLQLGTRTGQGPQRGSAASIILGALAVALTVGLAAWFYVGPTSSASSAEAIQPDAAATERPTPPPGMMLESDLIAMEANGPRTVGGLETRPIGGHEEFTKAFGDVGGTVVGEIRIEGAEYPDVWTVTLEPSLAAEGRESAITKSVTSEPGMRTFELRDLPMAAYRLSASAPGLATQKIELALYRVKGRPNLRGLDFVHVDLTLRPMARMEGFVRQSNGDAADDLAVFLTPYKVPGAEAEPTKEGLDLTGGVSLQYKTRTNSAGSYVFEGVPPGPWLLQMGDPIRPLTAPVPVAVDNADQRLDDISLPPLADLKLVVLDQLARPCPGVKLSGYLRGAGSGAFQTVTDSVGQVNVRYLTPGPWRVDADDTELEQKGRADVVLKPGGRTDGRLEEIQLQ